MVGTLAPSPAPPDRLTSTAGPEGRARGLNRRSRTNLGNYGLAAPAVVLLLLITAYPLIYNLWNSLHNVNLGIAGQHHPFVGLAHYGALLASTAWRGAFLRTTGFTAVSVGLETLVGLGLALMLNRRFVGRGLLRAAILVPWAVPTVVSATLWKSMFDPRSGFVDYLLSSLHLPGAGTTWLAGEWTSWVAIITADAWKNVPFVAIVLLAGLQVVPDDIYEAARIDGASSWQSFRRLTLPLLRPALAVALIFRTLQAFLVFDVVYIMTGGGPGVSTETLSYLNWQAFLVNTDFGAGGAMSVALVLVSMVIAVGYIRALRPEPS